MITALHEDRHHTMWLGSTRGLSRFMNGAFQTLRHGKELPGGRLTAVQEDAAGNLWLGIDYGLVRMARGELERAFVTGARVTYDLYDASDGLLSSPTLIGYPNAARGADGALWFTTAAGAVTVLPAQSRQRAPLYVTIDELVVDGRPVPHGSTMTLPAAAAQLQFGYSALALRGPQSVHFRYKLEGIDADWVDNGRGRRVSYASVPPGRYRFLVRASDGVVDAETALAIAIPPSLHQTGWFQGTAAASGAFILMLIWRSRVNRMRHDLALVEDERSRVSREIHDTLLQSLVGTALHLDHMSEELQTTQPALSVRLARTRRHLERHIDDAHQAIFELRTRAAAHQDLAASLDALCQKANADPAMTVVFEMTGVPTACPGAFRHHLLRIAGEAVMNAQRHARARHITVGLTYADAGNELGLRIQDDGQGFDPAAPAPDGEVHFGLSIIRERVQQIRGTLVVDSAPGQGTTVYVSVRLRATSGGRR